MDKAGKLDAKRIKGKAKKIKGKVKAIKQHPKWPRWRNTFGLICIVAGVLGVFLPLIPGLLLIAIGVYFYGDHTLINWFKKNFKEHWRKCMQVLKR